MILLGLLLAFAQVPQVSKIQPGYDVSFGNGLVVYIAPGSINCLGTLQSYPGSSMTLTANSVNYIGLSAISPCAPVSSTVGFSSNFPLAIVTTSSTGISSVSDARSMTSMVPSTGGVGTVTSVAGISPVGGNVALTPANVGALNASSNLSDLGNVTTARSNLGLGTAAITAASAYDVAGAAAGVQAVSIPLAQMGAASGVATLDSTSHLPSAQLPLVLTTQQILTSGSVPTIANGSGAGTTPGTPTISGTNVAGVITVITGTSPASISTLATITLNGTLTTAFRGCSLFPRNSSAAGQVGMIYTTAPTSTSWTIAVAGSPLSASSTYSWSYLCV